MPHPVSSFLLPRVSPAPSPAPTGAPAVASLDARLPGATPTPSAVAPRVRATGPDVFILIGGLLVAA